MTRLNTLATGAPTAFTGDEVVAIDFGFDTSIPIIVELDGTLIRNNSLHESIVLAVFLNPKSILELAFSTGQGSAALKRTAFTNCNLDASLLCYRENIIALLQQAKKRGHAIFLVTAADQGIADAIQEHLGLFDGAKGSDGQINLKGKNKLAWLNAKFPKGFAYIGDSSTDIKIWEASKMAYLVGGGVANARRLRKSGRPVETIPDSKASAFGDWAAELRLHQWAKNLLIFVPLFLGHIAGHPLAVVKTSCAFFIFGLVASATYIINDLADLQADRNHSIKRFRAIASGRIPVAQAVWGAVAMLAVGLAAGFLLSPPFALVMMVYFLVTLTYSFGLKRVPLLDVTVIGTLFTLRIVMGTVLHPLIPSPWLLSFSTCFFVSLALAKRHVEVMRMGKHNQEAIAERGYVSDDWPLTLGFGIATAVASIIIMLLFIREDASISGAYATPAWLYVAPFCVFLWVLRIWFLSNRMELNDDPVIFALRDRVSYLLGFIVLVAFGLAL